MSDRYFDTGIVADVVDNLRLLSESLSRLDKDIRQFKWVVIAAHMAAQTSLIGFLSGTAGLGALTKRAAGKQLDWLNDRSGGTEIPKDDRIAEFPELLKRAAAGGSFDRADAILQIDPEHFARFDKLHWHRSRFNHLRDAGWSIEVSGVPEIIEAVVDLISKVLSEGWAFRHATDDEFVELNRLLEGLRDFYAPHAPLNSR